MPNQLMDRGDINYILSAGKLTQQYIVDQYCKMETQRLNYIHHNQTKLRADNYQNFQDQMLANDNDANVIGQRVILPATYTGGPRYMFEKQANAMARVRKFGKPALLLTMTTSPAWEEITEHVGTNQTSQDHPDLVARVFCLKYKMLMQMVV
jgi:hypothetical protein